MKLQLKKSEYKVNSKRIRSLNSIELKIKGPVVYWMSRDQRANDNWAFLYAYQKAIELEQQIVVVFCLQTDFLHASSRHYNFMLEGLEEVEKNLNELNVEFVLIEGKPHDVLPEFLTKINASSLVTDFSPLKIKKHWLDRILEQVEIPVFEVDAHNLVPVWESSTKQEFAAHTFRPKMHKLFDMYAEDFPHIPNQNKKTNISNKINWDAIRRKLNIDKKEKYDWIESGEKAGRKAVKNFFENLLPNYNAKRNDPTQNAQSNLSAYLHYGQLSAQRIVLELFTLKPQFNFHREFKQAKDSNEVAFIEELIVRRELSENFCFYNSNYDKFEGIPLWAQQSLNKHKSDKREFIYSKAEFETAKTHDPLWNAAQLEMIKKGKMHGYMRMYWAKKILEWSASPEEAIEIAIYLNDKYELDGRDPNGYTGVLWSIGGLHDRPWVERKIYGKIRYMNYNGCKRKFDVEKYIQQVSEI